MSASQAVFLYLFSLCALKIVNIVLGDPVKRLARRIAMYGEPVRDQWQPTKYVEGGWR